MTAPKYARGAARLLAFEPQIEQLSGESRARAITAMEAALLQRRVRARRVQTWRTGLTLLGAAAAAALIVKVASPSRVAQKAKSSDQPSALTVVAHPTGGGIQVVREGVASTLSDGANVTAGTRLLSGNDGRVALSLSTGTLLSLDNGSDFTLLNVGPTEAFRVDNGSIRADVAKLTANERFLVEAPDLEVEVHGTSFRVTVVPESQACADGSRSQVVVYEGVVTVRKHGIETKLRAGDEFKRSCGASTTGATSETSSAKADAEPRPTVASRQPAAVTVGRRTAKGGDRSPSSLAEQNNLFAEALSYKRSGANTAAVTAFDRLLSRYPGGPLVESATAERMRVLRAADPTVARAAAKKYLEKFPAGFARADAEGILSNTP